jgi:hypothetical protein
MRAHSKVGKSERQAAVLALLRREEPAQVLARLYGVSKRTPYSWWAVFLQAGPWMPQAPHQQAGNQVQASGITYSNESPKIPVELRTKRLLGGHRRVSIHSSWRQNLSDSLCRYLLWSVERARNGSGNSDPDGSFE